MSSRGGNDQGETTFGVRKTVHPREDDRAEECAPPKRPRTATNKSPSEEKSAGGSDVLTLNIGGKETVETLRSTLTFVAGSNLAELLVVAGTILFPRARMEAFH